LKDEIGDSFGRTCVAARTAKYRREACAGSDDGDSVLLSNSTRTDSKDISEDFLHFANPSFLTRAETEPHGSAVRPSERPSERSFGAIVPEQARNARRNMEECGHPESALRSAPDSAMNDL